jgi:hypothetical protein
MRKRLVSSLLIGWLFNIASANAQVPADPYNYTRTSKFTYDAVTGLLNSERNMPNCSNA